MHKTLYKTEKLQENWLFATLMFWPFHEHELLMKECEPIRNASETETNFTLNLLGRLLVIFGESL